MNWTELKHYAPLTDVRKFVKFASENKLQYSQSCESDSYFCIESESRERMLANIMEYDFFDIEKIEELFGKTLNISRISNVDVLLRITAAAMLRNKPKETGVRERIAGSEPSAPGIEWKTEKADIKNEIDRAPPQFY